MEEKEEIPKHAKKIVIYFWIGIAVTVLIMYNQFGTIEQVEVPAPCFVIMNNSYELPDNVITKGFTVSDDPDNPDGKDCYYIKNATLIERLYRNWNVYDRG